MTLPVPSFLSDSLLALRYTHPRPSHPPSSLYIHPLRFLPLSTPYSPRSTLPTSSSSFFSPSSHSRAIFLPPFVLSILSAPYCVISSPSRSASPPSLALELLILCTSCVPRVPRQHACTQRLATRHPIPGTTRIRRDCGGFGFGFQERVDWPSRIPSPRSTAPRPWRPPLYTPMSMARSHLLRTYRTCPP
ncbi:hypothetical protein DFH06DRAFT_465748 [Mycena polygramma]|nr:hypothetical protein DFH06DRAFT_465748 [Mycena polygramma]